MTKLLLCVCASALLGACASDPVSSTESAPSERAVDKEYRTGSHIPSRHRDGVIVVSPEDFERQRSSGAMIGKRPPGMGQ